MATSSRPSLERRLVGLEERLGASDLARELGAVERAVRLTTMFRRDPTRAAVLVAKLMTSCPQSAEPGNALLRASRTGQQWRADLTAPQRR